MGVLAACSSDRSAAPLTPSSSSFSGSRSTSTSVATTTPTTDPNKTDFVDLDLARAANISYPDLAPGWKQTYSTPLAGQGLSNPPVGSSSVQHALARCLHVTDRTVNLNFLPHHYVVQTGPENDRVDSIVTIFPTIAGARASFTANSGPLAPSCKAAEIHARVTTPHVVATGAFTPTGLAGHTTMIRETLRVPGGTSVYHWDFLYGERGVAFVYMEILTRTLDTRFEVGLLSKSLERMRSLHIADAN